MEKNERDLKDIDGATHLLEKKLVEFERDLLYGILVSQQWQWQISEEPQPSTRNDHLAGAELGPWGYPSL